MDPGDQLRLFLHRARELFDTRMLRRGFDPGFSISFDSASPARIDIGEPEEEDLRSFLLTFRQFVSPNEPVHVSKIHNICWQHLISDELRRELTDAQDKWRNARRVGSVSLVIGKQAIHPERLLDLWVNGYYFHNDHRKATELRRLVAAGLPFTRHVFLSYIADTVRYIAFLRKVVAYALTEGQVR